MGWARGLVAQRWGVGWGCPVGVGWGCPVGFGWVPLALWGGFIGVAWVWGGPEVDARVRVEGL
ncbi:hypothetical protein GCM10008938_37820 [Deinococcus roseus]|uniref:Uncharacterized protein n=1 Tax=Deinococcus roseus TaxID=392414 RepID=A0ABQ2D756_9DEIO|nr:hypothetical protein GCM10008938_37820 [Deinococcus roseus]